jgi:hypothetical protein
MLSLKQGKHEGNEFAIPQLRMSIHVLLLMSLSPSLGWISRSLETVVMQRVFDFSKSLGPLIFPCS